jgi:DNA-binding CsgD family transcriptional regulator
MSLSVVPLTSETLPLCVPLWVDRIAYQPRDFERAVANAGRLLGEERALGAMIVERGHVRAFGVSAFANPRFLDEYLSNPDPQIGKRLLLGAYEPNTHLVLTLDEIARGNRKGGLHLVILNASHDRASPQAPAAFGRMVQAFMDTHRGYRIERMVTEAFIPDAVLNIESAGSEIVRRFGEIRPGTGLLSAVAVLTRAQAIERKTVLLPAFTYEPPRLHLTPAEQQLLRAALDGETDEGLSRKLGISVSSVKARWTRIQQRIVKHAPELVARVPPRIGDHRGASFRHLVMDYLRKNPSELTPYAWNHPDR